MGEVEDEVEVIRSIFCAENEFMYLQSDPPCLELQLKTLCSGKEIPLNMRVSLPPSYPEAIPHLNFHGQHITNVISKLLTEHALDHLEAAKGQPMLLDLALWVQESAGDIIIRCQQTSGSDTTNNPSLCIDDALDETHIALLHLDHMRAKSRYVKTIEKWTADLDLKGRLLFLDRLIFILLQGSEKAIKDYITCARTSIVDVDSKGRSCKERMLTVILHKKMETTYTRFCDFVVNECSSQEDFVHEFTIHHMEDVFDSYIKAVYFR